MKNIHVLPTEKPSRFCIKVTDGFQGYDFHLYNERKRNTWYRPQHIYITSDEKPKNNDWCYDKSIEGRIVRFTTLPKHWHDSQKKIILTTDPNLISDGVQGIDDDFLEWFVKNPSCKFVDLDTFSMGDKVLYNVVFPQEEPKQETVKVPCSLCDGTGETVFSGTYTTQKTCDLCNGEKYWDKKVLVEQSKQETLEKAAEKYAEEENSCYTNDYYGFIKGAKWQAERMYSEEDMEKAFYEGLRKAYSSKKHSTCWKEWFEQFKKQK